MTGRGASRRAVGAAAASRDLFDEILAGLFARPMRSLLTTLGTVLGLASLIATVGLSRTAGSQIIEQFDELHGHPGDDHRSQRRTRRTQAGACRGRSRSGSTV